MPAERIDRVVEGGTEAAGLKLAIVAARFNSEVTDKLLSGALESLKKAGAREKDLTVIRVPGAWDIPLVARELIALEELDAIVALGAVIKGETSHDRWVAEGAIGGLAELCRVDGMPIGLGILTTEDESQALERAGGKHGNKGADAALAAVEMANLKRKLGR